VLPTTFEQKHPKNVSLYKKRAIYDHLHKTDTDADRSHSGAVWMIAQDNKTKHRGSIDFTKQIEIARDILRKASLSE